MGTNVLLDPPTKQQAYEASLNSGIIRPTNEAPSPVDTTVVIEEVTKGDDVEIETGENDVEVQECKVEKKDPDVPKSEFDRISAGLNGD